MTLYTNIIGKPLDLGDGNVVVVENIVIEAPSLRRSGTIVHIEGEVVSSNQSNQDVLNTIKKYATKPDLCYDSISFKNECFKNCIRTTGELYRNFQVTPEKVIFNDPATIVFWKDGTKTVVKCMEGDTYNPEVGLAMCVCKKVFDKKYHKIFKYYVPKEPSLDEICDKISEMTKDFLKTDKSFLEKFASQLFSKEENISQLFGTEEESK